MSLEQFIAGFKKEERVTLALRQLYESLNYQKFRMRKFEEYQLYADNKNFLKDESVITFHDLDGKLLALKPDVTLSIVKNTKARIDSTEKLYYIENVYRLNRATQEYKEINQMGLECMGKVDGYAGIEVIHLAVKSLEAIDEECLLDIGHMGYISGILDNLAIDDSGRQTLLDFLRHKNAHELKKAIAQMDISPFYAERLEKLPELSGCFEDVIAAAKALAVNEAMYKAVEELEALYAALEALGVAQKLRLDFSIINDMDYYTGVIFQGYVKRVPQAVLSGGRYDNLLKKFSRDVQAIGFALYLDGLNRYYPAERPYDVDVLALNDGQDEARFAQAVWQLTRQGFSVRAGAPEDKIRYKKRLAYRDGQFVEVEILD